MSVHAGTRSRSVGASATSLPGRSFPMGSMMTASSAKSSPRAMTRRRNSSAAVVEATRHRHLVAETVWRLRKGWFGSRSRAKLLRHAGPRSLD